MLLYVDVLSGSDGVYLNVDAVKKWQDPLNVP